MTDSNSNLGRDPEKLIDIDGFEAEFGKEFGDQYSPYMDNEIFERIAFLKDRIGDLEGLLGIHRKSVREIDEFRSLLLRQEAILREMIRELERQRYPLDGKRNDVNSVIRDDTRSLDRARQELAKIQAELDSRRRLRMEVQGFMDRTKDAPWASSAKPYQVEGAQRMAASKRAILADHQGLGKTLESIMAIDMLGVQKVLIVTKKAILNDFQSEVHRWADSRGAIILDKMQRDQRHQILDLIAMMPQVVLVVNFESWNRDRAMVEKLKAARFEAVIIDEAHYIKNAKTTAFKTIREIVYAENKCINCGSGHFETTRTRMWCTRCEHTSENFGDFCSVQYVYPMTGTPILNKPQELWPMLHLVDRVAFPKESDFLEYYCQRLGGGKWGFAYGGQDRLLKRLGSRFIRRTRDQVGVDIPPQKERHPVVELDAEKYPQQYALIKLLQEKARMVFGDGSRVITYTVALEWYLRMRQAAVWPDGIEIKNPETKVVVDTIRIKESAIMDYAFEGILESVEEGNRILLGSHFKSALKEMERRLIAHGVPCIRYDGDLSASKKDEARLDFDLKHTRIENSKYKVILANYRSAAEGLNLSGANHVITLDREWNRPKEEQFLARVQRLDSENPSFVDILHQPGTAHDLVDLLIADKQVVRDDLDEVVGLQEQMRKWLLEGDDK